MSMLRLRQQFFRYILIGILNFLIGALVLNLLARLTHVYNGPLLFIFSAVAFTVAVTNSYLCNRSWTFKDRKGSAIQYPLFYGLTLIGFCFGSMIIFVMTTYIHPPMRLSAPIWLNVANVVAAAFGILWNFTAYSQVVFRSSAPEVSN